MKNLIERAEAKLDEWGAKLEQKNIEYPVDLICGILFLVIGIVLLLIIPGMVPLTQNLGIEMQRAQNLHKYRSIIYGAMAIGNLAISIWLCRYLGAIGCAIGTAIAVALANAVSYTHLTLPTILRV